MSLHFLVNFPPGDVHLRNRKLVSISNRDIDYRHNPIFLGCPHHDKHDKPETIPVTHIETGFKSTSSQKVGLYPWNHETQLGMVYGIGFASLTEVL